MDELVEGVGDGEGTRLQAMAQITGIRSFTETCTSSFVCCEYIANLYIAVSVFHASGSFDVSRTNDKIVCF